MIVLPNRAQSGAVLAAAKTEPPPAVALPLVGPVLTAAARGAPRTQVGTEKRCFDRTKKQALYAMPDRPPEPIGKRDSHDCREE